MPLDIEGKCGNVHLKCRIKSNLPTVLFFFCVPFSCFHDFARWGSQICSGTEKYKDVTLMPNNQEKRLKGLPADNLTQDICEVDAYFNHHAMENGVSFDLNNQEIRESCVIVGESSKQNRNLTLNLWALKGVQAKYKLCLIFFFWGGGVTQIFEFEPLSCKPLVYTTHFWNFQHEISDLTNSFCKFRH